MLVWLLYEKGNSLVEVAIVKAWPGVPLFVGCVLMLSFSLSNVMQEGMLSWMSMGPQRWSTMG